MNSEYHNLPVPYFLNTDYNEYRETGNLLHIEGVSSCTDAEKLIQEIFLEFHKMMPEQKRFIISLVRSLASSEREETFSAPMLTDQRNL